MLTLPRTDRSVQLNVAIEAARIAARVIAACGEPSRIQKCDASPVTVADIASQCAITAVLLAQLSRLGAAASPLRIAGEESAEELERAGASAALDLAARALDAAAIDLGPNSVRDLLALGGDEGGSGSFWAIDPLDGTKGYLRGGQFAVAIALIEEGVPSLGVLAVPRLGPGGVIAFGALGGSAWEARLDSTDVPRRIAAAAWTPGRVRIAESVEAAHAAHDRAETMLAPAGSLQRVRLDSSAKYVLLARGDVDCYLRVPPKSGYAEKVWDHAAGVLLAREAGCVACDARGEVLRFDLGRAMTPGAGIFAARSELAQVVFGRGAPG
ncbi:MAG: hypothetical protein EXS00_06770 [Phycisphaerales bacterium]|nr:hypothetical protein [Phycisphaerales bacterium]